MKTNEEIRREAIRRLERKRTILNWIEAITYAVFIIFCIWVIANFTPIEQPEGQVIEHTVKTGENLTSIASKYSDEYVLKTIASIKKLNNIIESDLYVGQVLKIKIK